MRVQLPLRVGEDWHAPNPCANLSLAHEGVPHIQEADVDPKEYARVEQELKRALAKEGRPLDAFELYHAAEQSPTLRATRSEMHRALWRLASRREVEFTRDWLIRSPVPPRPAAAPKRKLSRAARAPR